MADSRKKAAATRSARPRRRHPPRSTRWRGCWSTCRWRTSTGPSTTSSPPRWPTTAVPGARVKVRFAGQDVDALRRRPRRGERPRRPADAAAPGGQRRAGAGARDRRAQRAPSPSGTPGPAPTCCGWPSRPGTPPPRRSRPPPPTPAATPTWPPASAPGTGTRTAEAFLVAPGRRRRAAGGLGGGAGHRLAGRWSPTPRRRPSPPAAARWSACPTHGRRPGRRRADRGPGRGPPRHAHRRRRARRCATATSSPSPAARPRIVVGTRAAAFAPVHDLGLVVLWDDGDDLHAEPRAPYPHTREVLLLRAEQQGTAALLGGFARTVEAQYLLRTGWAREIAPTRDAASGLASRSRVAGATDRDRERDPHAPARGCPPRSTQAVRDALEHGPVLVQTPRLRLRAVAWPASAAATPARCRPAPARCACRADRAADLPLVRAPRSRPGPAPSAGTAACGRRCVGDGRHRRGARPRVPGRPRCAPPAATGCSPRSRPAGDRGRHPGRRAGGRGRATPPSCCSTPG